MIWVLAVSGAVGCGDPGAELCDEPDFDGGGDEVGAIGPNLSHGYAASKILGGVVDGAHGPAASSHEGSTRSAGFRSWALEDPRNPVTDEDTLQSYPLRTVAQVRLQWPKSNFLGFNIFTGTGFLVGPRHLITNRHVVEGTGGDLNEWIDDPPMFFHLDVYPGRSKDAVLNGGAWAVERVVWNPYPKTRYDDYVLLILEDDVERSGQYGRMGLCSASESTLEGRSVFMAGYPGATQPCDNTPEQQDDSSCPCGGWMYFQSCEIEEVEPEELIHTCVSQDGHSGSPLWVNECGSSETRCSVGIHYGEVGLDPGAVRWRDDDIDWLHDNICQWTSEYAQMPPFCN